MPAGAVVSPIYQIQKCLAHSRTVSQLHSWYTACDYQIRRVLGFERSYQQFANLIPSINASSTTVFIFFNASISVPGNSPLANISSLCFWARVLCRGLLCWISSLLDFCFASRPDLPTPNTLLQQMRRFRYQLCSPQPYNSIYTVYGHSCSRSKAQQTSTFSDVTTKRSNGRAGPHESIQVARCSATCSRAAPRSATLSDHQSAASGSRICKLKTEAEKGQVLHHVHLRQKLDTSASLRSHLSEYASSSLYHISCISPIPHSRHKRHRDHEREGLAPPETRIESLNVDCQKARKPTVPEEAIEPATTLWWAALRIRWRTEDGGVNIRSSPTWLGKAKADHIHTGPMSAAANGSPGTSKHHTQLRQALVVTRMPLYKTASTDARVEHGLNFANIGHTGTNLSTPTTSASESGSIQGALSTEKPAPAESVCQLSFAKAETTRYKDKNRLHSEQKLQYWKR
ncbi:hypothetical protein DOTSEDRAFT_33302 [Dothistroma septosporum NZE10]|uniref:Uncharacterized protein n=1 Tax=Dothistroma septosporum (strain NZE10 / CBS 128990) TaxID=675120 RepID=N1PX06_DOTSN|nr:hypothetical protein DOTSEDRAFT_33302 [Dothistroma septosporum NZE10]